jgi:hypothetical protein
MHLVITIPVAASIQTVKAGFTESLFKALAPPFPKVDLVHFGGSKTGDKVHVRLHFPLLPAQNWISDIIADTETENQWYFIDKGVELHFANELLSLKTQQDLDRIETYLNFAVPKKGLYVWEE